jgi:glycosyltransferase involved in cell wall biosynthesis
MKILYAAFDVVPSPKGAGRHITQFTRTLVAAGHDVTLFTAGLEGMPAAERYAGARALRYLDREDNFLGRALRFGDAVWEHLRQAAGDYDVVHFRDIWSGAAALEARNRFDYSCRLLFEVNGLPSVELKYHYPALRDIPALSDPTSFPGPGGVDGMGQTLLGSLSLTGRLRDQESILLRQADAIVCVSCVTAIYLCSLGASPNSITIIPNGVEPDCFAPAGATFAARPRLVYVGTLADWQGLSTLIRAMPGVLAAFPDAELHLVGPAKSRQQRRLLKLAARLGLSEDEVRFLGPLEPDEIPGVLQTASVCLAPLAYNDRNVTQGCCPIKVLEYAAAARPIVASDLPVVRELLGEGEALFFQPDDPVDLARQVIHLLSHPNQARAMADRAAHRVGRDFTWERAGQRLLDVYATLQIPAPTAGTPPAAPNALAPV